MNKKEIKASYRARKRQLRSSDKQGKKALKKEYIDTLFDYYKQSGRAAYDPPKRSVLEEIGNSVTHGIGAVFAVVAFILMLISSERALEYVSASVYFLGQAVMFTVSCLYHAFRHGTAVKRLFRRFDSSSIYLLIGATFAPILLCYVGGVYGTVFFIIQWSVIVTGITLVGVFGPSRLRFIHIPLYLLLGWCGLIILPLMIRRGDFGFLWFILGGGIIYSLGVIPFAIKARVSHFIWHFFVLAGAVVQWIGVYTCIYL